MGPKQYTLPNAIAFGLVIKLARLRQINLLVFEVIHLEQGSCAFARGRRKNRRIDQSESVRIEIIANAFDHLMTNADGGMLAAASQPEMPMIHQKIDAVFFRRYGVRMLFGYSLIDFSAADIQLKSARRRAASARMAP